MPPSLCHVFVLVEPDAPPPSGLTESFRRRHPGQGTANRCFCLDNAYLELLWVEDAAEVGGPAIARTRLAERARWRETGASPFGIALRGDQPAPFATWDYAPPYLPAGMTIPVALASDDPRHPFVFVSPGTSRPDQWTDGRAGARQTAAGLRMIEGVALDGPLAVDLSGAGIVTRDAGRPRMVLTLSRADGGPPRRLSLPDLEWID